MRDTPPAVDAMYRELLLSSPPADRVRMAASMYDAARAIIRAGIPADCWETETDLSSIAAGVANDGLEVLL